MRTTLRVALLLCAAGWVAASINRLTWQSNLSVGGTVFLFAMAALCGLLALLSLDRIYQWIPASLLVLVSIPATLFLALYEPG